MTLVPSVPPAANPRHLSLSTEHYTPPDVVEAARASLGGIDLDPATSVEGNRVFVKAVKIYTADDDGFVVPWKGRVFLNPPGGKCDRVGTSVVNVEKTKRRTKVDVWTCDLAGKAPCQHDHQAVQSSQKQWWRKLVGEWGAGRVRSAVFVGFSLEILQVTQSGSDDGDLVALDFPICVPRARVPYYREDDGSSFRISERGSPPHASVLVFLPDMKREDESMSAFRRAFGAIGRVVVPLGRPWRS